VWGFGFKEEKKVGWEERMKWFEGIKYWNSRIKLKRKDTTSGYLERRVGDAFN